MQSGCDQNMRQPTTFSHRHARFVFGKSWIPFPTLQTTHVLNFLGLLCCVAFVINLSWSNPIGAHEHVHESPARFFQRPIGEIRKDLKAFLKRSKSKDDPISAVGAIVDLCQLHYEIVNDERFEANDQLKSLRAITATRLKNCRKEIELDIKRRDRRLAKEAIQARRMDSPSASRSIEKTQKTVLNARSNPEDPQDSAIFQSAHSKFEAESLLAESMSRDIHAMSAITGGPLQAWTHVGGNFAPLWDHGPELVALIESTIDPQSWKRSGGDGVIHYYRPLRILVVTASASTQDDITQMLRNLRKLSR